MQPTTSDLHTDQVEQSLLSSSEFFAGDDSFEQVEQVVFPEHLYFIEKKNVFQVVTKNICSNLSSLTKHITKSILRIVKRLSKLTLSWIKWLFIVFTPVLVAWLNWVVKMLGSVAYWLLVKLHDSQDWLWRKKISAAIQQRIGPSTNNVSRLFFQKVRSLLYFAKEGHLSIYFMFKLGVKNLIYSKSRTLVTTGAIALGSGAIVFLVSFAYGLETIVTSRLIFTNATRIADVQTASTALVLDKNAVEEISQIGGIEAVAPAINAAGTLEYNNSKTDVVVIAAQNEFLSYSNLHPIEGELFSAVADQRYAYSQERAEELKELMALAGDVLGETNIGEIFSWGDLIEDKTMRFRVKDGVYLPLRSDPYLDSPILGYVRGSILFTYPGQEVWGETYQSTDTVGKSAQDSAGTWFGRWVKTSAQLHQEQAPTVYIPLVNEEGSQVSTQGYLPELELHILSQEELVVEYQLEQILNEKEAQKAQFLEKEASEIREGLVLGESTVSAELTDENGAYSGLETEIATVASSLRAATELEGKQDAADLTELLESQLTQVKEEEELKASLATIDVAREGGKEIIVSTGLLKIWDILPDHIIGKTVNLEYILSGGIVSGLAGRVKSNSVEYVVVGVIQDARSIVISPLGDLESMGTDRFTTLKILGKSEEVLKEARAHIEALGFATQSLTDTLEQVNKLFTVMRFLLGLFGAIALVVAIFGMFNTLTISLLERTREIGVMKTLGTTDADVLRLFMIESFLIGCLGGVLGVVLGTGLGYLINIIFNLFRSTPNVSLFVAPIGFLISVFFLSLMVGVLTGLYPSDRAKKISALDALRYE